MLKNEVSQYHLTCPFCYRGVTAMISHEDQSPHRGDYMVCPDCWGVGVLRDRTMYKKGWVITKPTFREKFLIAEHQGVRSILRSYEIAQFGNGVSAL